MRDARDATELRCDEEEEAEVREVEWSGEERRGVRGDCVCVRCVDGFPVDFSASAIVDPPCAWLRW